MAKIKKGDLVQVISGASQARGGDRGKQGKVLEVLVERTRVVVEGVNFVTKHERVGQTQRGTRTGGLETVVASSLSENAKPLRFPSGTYQTAPIDS